MRRKLAVVRKLGSFRRGQMVMFVRVTGRNGFVWFIGWGVLRRRMSRCRVGAGRGLGMRGTSTCRYSIGKGRSLKLWWAND